MLIEQIILFENKDEYVVKAFGHKIADVAKIKFKTDDERDEKVLAFVRKTFVPLDPTPNQKYLVWIAKIYADGNLKPEDFYKVTEELEVFNKVQQKLPVKDIMQYKTLPDLAAALNPYREEEAQMSGKEIARKERQELFDNGEAKVILRAPDYTVVQPLTHKASCELGKSTRWCTASKQSPTMFKSYSTNSDLWIVYHNKGPNPPYQIALKKPKRIIKSGSFLSIADATDRYLNTAVIQNLFPELTDKIRTYLNEVFLSMSKNIPAGPQQKQDYFRVILRMITDGSETRLPQDMDDDDDDLEMEYSTGGFLSPEIMSRLLAPLVKTKENARLLLKIMLNTSGSLDKRVKAIKPMVDLKKKAGINIKKPEDLTFIISNLFDSESHYPWGSVPEPTSILESSVRKGLIELGIDMELFDKLVQAEVVKKPSLMFKKALYAPYKDADVVTIIGNSKAFRDMTTVQKVAALGSMFNNYELKVRNSDRAAYVRKSVLGSIYQGFQKKEGPVVAEFEKVFNDIAPAISKTPGRLLEFILESNETLTENSPLVRLLTQAREVETKKPIDWSARIRKDFEKVKARISGASPTRMTRHVRKMKLRRLKENMTFLMSFVDESFDASSALELSAEQELMYLLGWRSAQLKTKNHGPISSWEAGGPAQDRNGEVDNLTKQLSRLSSIKSPVTGLIRLKTKALMVGQVYSLIVDYDRPNESKTVYTRELHKIASPDLRKLIVQYASSIDVPPTTTSVSAADLA